MNKRLLKMLVAELCYTVDYLAPSKVAAAVKAVNEDYQEYGGGQTKAQWLREQGYDSMPKAGWQWFVELNSEEGASGYGHPTYEAAVMAAFKKYGPKESPAAIVTKGILTSWQFSATIGRKHLLPGDAYKRLNAAYYIKRLREWYRLAAYRPNKLEKTWGFVPEAKAAQEVFWEHEAHVAREQLLLAHARIEELVPIEQLRAAAEQVGVNVTQNKQMNWQWVCRSMGNQVRDRFTSERAALVDICYMNGGLCGLRSYLE